MRFDVDRFPRQRFSRQGECERGADSSVCIILYMHHDLEARWMVELASHFKADDTEVVFSAIHCDEMKVRRSTGKICSSFEGAIGNHHHAIRPSHHEQF